MNLSKLFILRPVLTTLLMVSIFVFGMICYKKLPVSALPDVDLPVITVFVSFPGANPETMANSVATPLEQQFMTIPGIKYVTSTNNLGSSTIVLEFDIDKNIDLAAVDVQSSIVAAQSFLPPNLPQQPTFKKVNPSSSPVLYLAVTSPAMTLGELYDYAYSVLGERISIIEGVAEVSVYGSPSAVRAQIDPGYVASLGLTAEDIATAISNENQYQPLGTFDGPTNALNIYDNGGLLNAKAYRPLIVSYKNGAPTRLSDVSRVIDSIQMDRSSRRYIDKFMDQNSIILSILRQPNSNTVQVVDTINAMLPDLENQLPASLQFINVFDRAIPIKESIDEVQYTLVIALLLVVFVIFVYLGKIKETVIPSLSMPMSIIATFGIIYFLGYSLDNLSLLALILATGFIIDDAIVVLENIVRRVEGGETVFDASLNGSKQICFTIVSMTLSLVAVFIPLIFMPGLIGKLFEEFAVTLTIVTLMSGIISLTFTPMLCNRYIQPNHVNKIEAFSKAYNGYSLKIYKRALTWSQNHPAIAVISGALSIAITVVLLLILPTDFLPDEDIGAIIGYTEAEQGTSSTMMAEYHEQIVNVLKDDETIQSLVSLSSTPEYRQGIVFIRLISKDKRKNLTELVPTYAKKLREIPGVNVYLKPIPLIDLNAGNQVRGAYQYLIQSLNLEDLYESAETLIDKMKNDPIFQDVSSDLEIKTPQLNIEIQRDVASTLGINANALEQAFSLGFSGNRVSRIQTPINQYDVIVELQRSLQNDPNSLSKIYLRSSTTNELIPLSATANWTEGIGPASVNHFAQFPAVTVNFNIAANIPLSVGLEKLHALSDASFTSSVSGTVKGAAAAFEETIKGTFFLLLITLFIIYIVLGMLYESYIHPITILTTIPPAVCGGLLTLFIFDIPLSLYAFLGIILLIGIVKKNGIMMVDFALDNIRKKGEKAEKAIWDACITRFRPIMMTTFAAIMGALPIAIGGNTSLHPLGYVIIGGLFVSQLVTLFLTPIIFLFFERKRERWEAKKTDLLKSKEI